MKHARMAFLAVVLIVPAVLFSSASPNGAAAATVPAFREGGPESFGTPFVREVTAAFVPGNPIAEGVPFTVPAGKLLIAEYVSVSVGIDPGASTGAFAVIRTTNGTEVHEYYMPLIKMGGIDVWVGSHSLRIYVPGGATVNLIAGRNNDLSGGGGTALVLSGRLINE
jgi:hypothetical protein